MKSAKPKRDDRKSIAQIMSRGLVIDRAAAECVEELLAAANKDGGEPWFSIIRKKMMSLLASLNAVRRKNE